jgi:hypothetical protein
MTFPWQLAGILVDTENLDFASIRDIEMSNILVEGMGCIGRTSFYNQRKSFPLTSPLYQSEFYRNISLHQHHGILRLT